jgi:uncharacterized protein YlxP (DUF503 family)
MIVGVMKAQLHLQAVGSLKAKRSIVKSLIERLRSRFNVSASEVGHNDNKLSAVIAISIVSNQQQFIDQQFDKIVNFMHRDGRFYLGTVEREIF